MAEATVRHDDAKHRYVIEVDGTRAGHADYAERGGVRDFHHTEIDPQFRGQGLSGTLIREALDDTRAAGLSIRPSCSAVAGFVQKNEDYRDLVAR